MDPLEVSAPRDLLTSTLTSRKIKINTKDTKWIAFCEFGMLAFISIMHKTSVLTSQRTHSVPNRKSAVKEIFDIQG